MEENSIQKENEQIDNTQPQKPVYKQKYFNIITTIIISILLVSVAIIIGINTPTEKKEKEEIKFYYIGDTQIFNDTTYTLTNFVIANEIDSSLSTPIKADENNTLFQIKMKIKNLGQKTINLSGSDWKVIIDDTQSIYSARSYLFQNNSIFNESLQPYEEKEYEIIFSIPLEVSSKKFSLQFKYDDGLISDKYTYWKLEIN